MSENRTTGGHLGGADGSRGRFAGPDAVIARELAEACTIVRESAQPAQAMVEVCFSTRIP